MCHTAVIKLKRDVCKTQFLIFQKFFDTLYFVPDNEFLDGYSFRFRKDIGKIGVILV
ncbi:hypothetical protein D3C86_1228000 [compost metagenome]